MIVEALLKHLRRQVVRCSAKGLALITRTVTTPSKVSQLDCSIAVEQVFRLEVAMDYIFGMEVIHGLDDLPHIVGSFLL